MKLVSWNVNGIRSVLKKGFLNVVRDLKADVLCLQEVRATPEQAQLELPGYQMHWNAAQKPGYSGVAVFTRVPALKARAGMGKPKHDKEGRLLTLEYADFHLVNCYTPNSQRELTRLDYRTKEWDAAFLKYVRGLEEDKPVVFCGDLNTAHKEIDLARPKDNTKNAGFTPQERRSLDKIVEAGFLDTFREFVSEGGHYTWWSQMGGARSRNIGWRIDYFFVSETLRPRVKSASILPKVMGSDHCPVVLEIE